MATKEFSLLYIYIYSHPQTCCLVVSQLISVARHAERFKLGSKPAQLYMRLSIIPLIHQSTYVSSGIIWYNVVDFACLHFALMDTRELNSYEEPLIPTPVYFLVNTFQLAYLSNDIRWELVDKPSEISYFLSTFFPTLGLHQGRMYYKSDVTFLCTLIHCKDELFLLVYCVVFTFWICFYK